MFCLFERIMLFWYAVIVECNISSRIHIKSGCLKMFNILNENTINLKLSVLDTHIHIQKKVENSNFVLFVMWNSKTKKYLILHILYIWLSILFDSKNEQTFFGVEYVSCEKQTSKIKHCLKAKCEIFSFRGGVQIRIQLNYQIHIFRLYRI